LSSLVCIKTPTYESKKINNFNTKIAKDDVELPGTGNIWRG
jgi:hypothetical protein